VLAFNVHIMAVISVTLRCFNFTGSRFYPLDLWLWLGTLISFALLEDGILFKWWFYPHWSVWYRQRGPGADSGHLCAVLSRVNIWRATAVTRGLVLLLIWSTLALYVQRLLSGPVFVVHTIFTALGLRFARRWGGMLRPKMFAPHDAEWRLLDLLLP
jgi:dimethylaniline monooxygenase (N-oxide forming)